MNGLQIVQDLALYLNEGQATDVFKFMRPMSYEGEYIVVNHLPFAYSRALNDSNVLNVNIHVPALSSGNADIQRLTEIYSEISRLIPYDTEQEEVSGVMINGAYYAITSMSQPMEDADNTYFINVKVKVTTNQLKL